MLDAGQIHELWRERHDALAAVHTAMSELQQVYDGDRQFVTTEWWGAQERPAVPNIIAQGLEQLAMRVSSTSPVAVVEPQRPGVKKLEDQARTQRQVLLGWWDDNDLDEGKQPYRARELIGYGRAPAVVRPDYERCIPQWQLVSARAAYPAVSLNRDDMHPNDCVFALRRPVWWLQQRWPDAMARVFKGERFKRSDALTVLEFLSGEQKALVVTGAPRADGVDYAPEWGHAQAEMLESLPNRCGTCPVVIPDLVTLSRLRGLFHSLIGIADRQARMMALEELAIVRGIFTETWLESDSMQQAEIVTTADAREGIIGEVKGGKLREFRPDPSFAALNVIDRGERAMRVEGAMPAEWGGESGSNIRTGRRGESVLSATTDFRIGELQKLLARARRLEDDIAIEVDKAYFPKSKPVRVGWDKGPTYEARSLWTSVVHRVRYSHPGADANGLVVAAGQRIGLGTLSKREFMRLDPMIEDDERVYDEITVEALDAAGLAALQQQAASGAIPPADIARIKQLVASDRMSWEEAVMQVQKEAQERQSPLVDPVVPGSPEAQPGLAVPGAGAEAGTASPPPDLASLLGALKPPGQMAGAA